MRPSITLRISRWLTDYFRVLEALGLLFVFTGAALELLAIRDSDRQRSFFEQNVGFRTLMDETTFRAFWLKEQHLLHQPVAEPRLKDVPKPASVADRFEELANHSLDMHQMIWYRADMTNRKIAAFRRQVGMPASEELEQASKTLAMLRGAADSIRQEMKSIDGFVKFPLGRLRESEMLAESAREKTALAAQRTIEELEQRRSARSEYYFALFLLGSVLLTVGKYGNWLRERARPPRSDA